MYKRQVHPLAAEVAFGALEVEAVIDQDADQKNELQAEEERRVIPGLLHVQVLLVGVSFVQYFEDLLLLRSIERLEVPLYPRFAHIISLQYLYEVGPFLDYGCRLRVRPVV